MVGFCKRGHELLQHLVYPVTQLWLLPVAHIRRHLRHQRSFPHDVELLNYGYSQLPISGNIYDIKDHSLMTWSYHNTMSYRTGADLLLAYLVGATGLTAHQVYMPLIIAFNFCVMAGAGALSLLAIRKWSFALWTMALLALSPMLTIEVTMQQLAQAIGLAALTSLCVSYT